MNITKDIDKNIFREYDLRGIYNTSINEDISYTIGKAFGTYIKKFNENTCIVGHDNRLSSDSLNEALIKGILSTGTNVIDLGLVTTPMYYYSKSSKNIRPGIMITASHNPKDDNGYKMSFNTISNAKGKEILDFRDFVLNGAFDEGNGTLYNYDIRNEYIKIFKDNLNFGDRRLKVVIDCGNGTTSIIAKELYNMFPVDLITIYDESDGNFPNHHPDPIVEENMIDLKKKVIETNADIGIGFDGDGDRAGFVDNKGNIIKSDQYAVIILREILKYSNNKNVLYDVKCSKILNDEIIKLGAIPHESRTGASYTMTTVIDDNMIFGIEYSGHIYFNDGFPPISSGLYAGLKLIEILSKTNKSINEMLYGINKYYSTPEIKFSSTDDRKWNVIERIKQYSENKQYKTLQIDGVKVYFQDGWALVRCSNTGPNITARFEANTEEKLEEIKKEFVDLINKYNREDL
jgi:phosphomannomutase/phosphoglucomutase